MNQDIRYVLATYSTRTKCSGQEFHTVPTLRTALPLLDSTKLHNVSIRTYYKDHKLLPREAGYVGVDIAIKKLKVTYSVRCVRKRYAYRNYNVTYATLEDLIYSVLNYIELSQVTTMTYADILTSGEN